MNFGNFVVCSYIATQLQTWWKLFAQQEFSPIPQQAEIYSPRYFLGPGKEIEVNFSSILKIDHICVRRGTCRLTITVSLLYFTASKATVVHFLIRKIISNCFGGVDRNRRRNLSVFGRFLEISKPLCVIYRFNREMNSVSWNRIAHFRCDWKYNSGALERSIFPDWPFEICPTLLFRNILGLIWYFELDSTNQEVQFYSISDAKIKFCIIIIDSIPRQTFSLEKNIFLTSNF